VVQRIQLQFCRALVKLYLLVASDFVIYFRAVLLGMYLVEVSQEGLGIVCLVLACSRMF
jgi:hypothetical protein